MRANITGIREFQLAALVECTQSHFSLLLLLLAAAAACRRGASVAPYAPGYSCCCLDVLWGQPIKLVHVVPTSQLHE